jgi:UDP-N-acetylmuramoyl-tripeptide--D-alanyl-D-alanine ligase
VIPLSTAQIAAAVGGSLDGADPDVLVTDVVVDSRAGAVGSMYVAIAGERVDGHDFAQAAIEAGSVVVISSRPLRRDDGSALPCIVVTDPVIALGELAKDVLENRLSCKVAAITGSSGKTSTKDLLGAILAEAGPTVSPQGSFNTEVGVPLTILRADEQTRYLVVEMGMRGLGHIAYLAGICQPDVGLVINVGSAHVGMLGSREAIAEAKGELVASLRPEAVAVLNEDDPLVRAMAVRTTAAVRTFGESPSADLRASEVVLDADARPSFTVTDQRTGGTARAALRLSGEHYISNALGAASAAMALGVPLADAARALSEAEPSSRWRMEVTQTPGGITIINDAYNANPESTRAALKALVAMANGRRTWAVLGEMRELGDEALVEHDAIGRMAVRLDVSRLVCVGEGTRVMHLAASNEGSWGDESMYVEDVDSAIALLTAEVSPGDVVLVKASRSVGIERVALALIEGVTA